MSVVIFNHRRDLRIEDNIALYKCLKISNATIIPVFFFDPKQIILNNHNKHYFCPKSAYFVINSVIELKNEYKKIGSELLILYDEPTKCLKKIIAILKKKYKDDILFAYNKDYSKYSVL